MHVTIKDVAKLASVSPSTVSRVIADNPKISDATKKNVFKAMEELNYHPNAIARSLANKSTKILGLILPSTEEDIFKNPFFIQVMTGVSHYAQKNGYYILYTYATSEGEELEHLKKLMFSRWVDGIILTTIRKDDKCIQYLKENEYPFVVVGKPESTDGILWVDNDNFHAMYTVVNQLIQKGHRKIGFIGGPHVLNVTMNRLDGYLRAIENSGIQVDEKLIMRKEFTEEGGYEAMKNILAYDHPSAIVTTDDLIAFGALKALREEGIDDISVIGFNNTPLAAYQHPTLSSVDINAEKLGSFAARLLIKHLENRDDGINSYIIDTKFVERESSGKKK